MWALGERVQRPGLRGFHQEHVPVTVRGRTWTGGWYEWLHSGEGLEEEVATVNR